MSDVRPSAVPRGLVRVLSCVVPPFDPGELHELAVVDVAVGPDGSRAGPPRVKRFDVGFGRSRRAHSARISRHLSEAVWSGDVPGALAAHDASTASLVFAPSLTGPLRWISLHKVARRVWPGQPSYDVEALARWRAWAGPH